MTQHYTRPQVRRLTTGDENLWHSAIATVLADDDREDGLASSDEIAAALADPRCYMFVATQADDPVALLSAYRFPDLISGGEIVYLYDIEVIADRRRSGIGAELIRALIDSCSQDKAELIWAGTDVSNIAARSAFESTGAELEGESYVEYEWELADGPV